MMNGTPWRLFNWITNTHVCDISSPTGAYPVHGTPFLQSYSLVVDTRTGKIFEEPRENLFCTASSCLRKTNSRTLFILETKETIELEHDCKEVQFMHGSYLGYTDSNYQLWIRKDRIEYPCGIDVRTLSRYDGELYCQGPYIVEPKGVYSLETGKKILDFPLDIEIKWGKQSLKKHVRIFQNSLNEWLVSYLFWNMGTERNKKVTYCIDKPLEAPVEERLMSGELLQEGPLVCSVRYNQMDLQYAGQISSPHTVIEHSSVGNPQIRVHAIYNSCLLVQKGQQFYKVDLLDQGENNDQFN